MNKVFLMGRVTNKPDIRYTQEKKAIARWTLAVDRGKSGTDFISCNAWEKTAELAEKYLDKGTKIAIDGSIKTGSYEKDGHKVYTTDVVVNSFEFCEKKGAENPSDDGFASIDDIPEGELPFN